MNDKVADKTQSRIRLTQEILKAELISPEVMNTILMEQDSQDCNVKALTKLLVKKTHLTVYQAQEIWKGRARSLRLGAYVLLDLLGEGGMGQVFKARHRTMERVVALKVLNEKLVKSEALVKRFHQEVRTAAQLTHPNIVTAFDAGEHEGTHYLVMEYVQGKDLATLLDDRHKLTVPDAIDFILQAARGLSYAHGKGIIHRDIKPANLLLSNDGIIKILDMGLARMARTDDSTELTKPGEVMGTVSYMAPEQARQSREADPRSDIYSLGCTLYKLVTGNPMYQGETAISILLAHQNDPIPSLNAPHLDVASELDDIFHRMVAKNQDERTSSMDEVITQLEQVSKTLTSPPREKPILNDSINDELTQFFSELDRTEATMIGTVNTHFQKTTTGRKSIEKRRKTGIWLWSSIGLGLALITLLVMFFRPDSQKTDQNRHNNNSESRTATDNSSGNLSNAESAIQEGQRSILSRRLDEVVDFDRHVANCILETGGQVTLDSGTGQVVVTQVSDLPSEQFQIVHADLYELKPLNKAEWECFSELSYLTTLRFLEQVSFSDEDAENLSALQLPTLTTLELQAGFDFTDLGMQHIASLRQLRTFALYGGRLSDQSLKWIAQMPHLANLHLSTQDTQLFSSAGLQILAQHDSIYQLGIDAPDMKDEEFAILMQLPELSEIALYNMPQISAEGFASLKDVEKLTWLSLNKGDYSNEQVAAIVVYAPGLKGLGLCGSQLGDPSLKSVAMLKQLTSLRLERCQEITEDGLSSLVSLPELRAVTMPAVSQLPHVTEDGLNQLMRKNSDIDWQFTN